jgi:hypothetical protein
MDTQIRPVTSAPSSLVEVPAYTVVLQEKNRNPIDWSLHNLALAFGGSTLPLPARATTASASIVSTRVATVDQLREAILRCATEAQAEEKTDTDARLHSFIAKLSGSMECLGEVEMDHALWDLMKMRADPVRRQAAATVDASATEQLGGAYL